jgi:hypothetical protein
MDQAKLNSWLALHPLAPCSNCSPPTNKWDVGPNVLFVPNYLGRDLDPPPSGLAVISAACRQCGCVRFLSAQRIGLV